ncbi:hypothetical protein SAMN05216420_101378 [Nitrosospira sp. Nl5]|nr:hypothetical protein SAMN05216420_101378 [Nitrosospira sp. Nl5]
MSRRIGKFSVHRDLIDRDPGVVALALGRVVVVRATDSFYERVVEYVALGDVFDYVPDSDAIPEYQVLITAHHYAPLDIVNYSVKFVKVSPL